jgi:DnaK suppressor protein
MDIAKRLTDELQEATARLRNGGRSAAVPEPHAGEEHASVADIVEGAQIVLDQEIAFATRSLLHERAHRLAGALARIRDGSYGICEECGEAIAPARLRALPEVATCLPCQRLREAGLATAAASAEPVTDGFD